MSTSDQKMNKIATLSSILLSTLDEGIFFAKLSSHIRDIFQNDNVQIFVARGEQGVQLVANDGAPVAESQIMELSKGLAGHVVKMKRAYYSNSVKRDPLLSSMEHRLDINAELAVPMNIEGSLLGAVQISSSSDKREFSEEDVTKIISILNELEIPLRNMKMYLVAKNLNRELIKKIEESKREVSVKSISAGDRPEDISLMGHSLRFAEMMAQISKVAQNDGNVIICGQVGTGRELVARKIYSESQRSRGRFIMVNCSAIKESLLEAEIFGVEKGVFGANNEKEGLIERAHGGILVFDEITNLGSLLQAKILRFIETGTAYRVGSHRPYVANVRIISITKSDIGKEVEDGRFREDLLYRLNSTNLRVPSLSERRDDIKLLSQHYLNRGVAKGNEKSLTYAAVEVLSSYNWPGNVRELQSVMERVRVLSEGVYVDVNDLQELVKIVPQSVEDRKEEYQDMTLEDLEKRHICITLKHLDGNKTRTAKALGITVKTLYNKLHSYGMVPAKM